MDRYCVHDESTSTDYWCIAPGPANALQIVATMWGLDVFKLQCYNFNGYYEGRWSA